MADRLSEGASAPSLDAMVRAWREPQGDTETLALLRKANRKQKEPDMAKQKPTVPTWIYPLKGGEGKIVNLEPGAKPPAGFVFSPSDQKPLTEESEGA